jgi:hypothetical protein
MEAGPNEFPGFRRGNSTRSDFSVVSSIISRRCRLQSQVRNILDCQLIFALELQGIRSRLERTTWGNTSTYMRRGSSDLTGHSYRSRGRCNKSVPRSGVPSFSFSILKRSGQDMGVIAAPATSSIVPWGTLARPSLPLMQSVHLENNRLIAQSN